MVRDSGHYSDRFGQCAFVSVACDAAFVVIAAAILMFAFSFNPALALKIGAGIALAFALRLIYRLAQLSRKGVCHTELWQIMEPDELPHEAQAIRWAQQRLEVLLLRFAKGASAVSVALFAAAFVITLN
jgi:hypothetical protein